MVLWNQLICANLVSCIVCRAKPASSHPTPQISQVRKSDTERFYDINYNDGDRETAVKRENILFICRPDPTESHDQATPHVEDVTQMGTRRVACVMCVCTCVCECVLFTFHTVSVTVLLTHAYGSKLVPIPATSPCVRRFPCVFIIYYRIE